MHKELLKKLDNPAQASAFLRKHSHSWSNGIQKSANSNTLIGINYLHISSVQVLPGCPSQLL